GGHAEGDGCDAGAGGGGEGDGQADDEFLDPAGGDGAGGHDYPFWELLSRFGCMTRMQEMGGGSPEACSLSWQGFPAPAVQLLNRPSWSKRPWGKWPRGKAERPAVPGPDGQGRKSRRRRGLPDREGSQALWLLSLHGDVRHHGQARAMVCPVHQVLHVAGGALEDGFDPAVVQVAHPPGYPVLPGH